VTNARLVLSSLQCFNVQCSTNQGRLENRRGTCCLAVCSYWNLVDLALLFQLATLVLPERLCRSETTLASHVQYVQIQRGFEMLPSENNAEISQAGDVFRIAVVSVDH